MTDSEPVPVGLEASGPESPEIVYTLTKRIDVRELLIARLECRESRGEVPRAVPEARLGVTGSGRVVRLSYLQPAIRN